MKMTMELKDNPEKEIEKFATGVDLSKDDDKFMNVDESAVKERDNG